MARPSNRSPERKLQVVLSVLRGEQSVAEGTRRAGVAEATVHNRGGGVCGGGPRGPCPGPAAAFVSGAGARD